MKGNVGMLELTTFLLAADPRLAIVRAEYVWHDLASKIGANGAPCNIIAII